MMIADMHLHLYPGVDPETALRGCVQRLALLDPDAVCVGCLVERFDCRVYASLLETAMTASPSARFEVLEDKACIRFSAGRGLPPLFLLPGRQIATRERLEVLCIGMDAVIPDGEPAARTVRRVRELDGVPVLPWGVGKWLFRRRRQVMSLLDQFGPSQLLLGDSAMRPVFWPTPRPIRVARRRGYRLVAGSDPLPHETGAAWMGRYATRLDCPFDPRRPSASLRHGLMEPATSLSLLGHRCGPLAFIRRMRG